LNRGVMGDFNLSRISTQTNATPNKQTDREVES
jgi:hypothetical protein